MALFFMAGIVVCTDALQYIAHARVDVEDTAPRAVLAANEGSIDDDKDENTEFEAGKYASFEKDLTVGPEKEEEKQPAVQQKRQVQQPAQTTPPPPSTSQWPVTYSNTQAASLTVVVNKKHRLSSSYTPPLVSVQGGYLRPEAASALNQLFTDASKAGVSLKIISSFRSYSTQVATYNRWVARSGQAQADTFSARPGHSEHQTGLAVDVGGVGSGCDLSTCFGNTPAGQWVAANAHNYGFFVRYPAGMQGITGYQYEPWHLRYVGSAAAAIVGSGLTMDQYYGVAAGGYQ